MPRGPAARLNETTMSQAALLTNPALAPARTPPRTPAWLWLRRAATVVVPVFIVALAAGPQARQYWAEQLTHLHVHAPQLELLAWVWRTQPIVLLHMSCAFAALGIGTALMIGVKGTAMHRTLGYAWSAFMLVTAISSFWIRGNHGSLSFIHFLSGWTTSSTARAGSANPSSATPRPSSTAPRCRWSRRWCSPGPGANCSASAAWRTGRPTGRC